MTVKEIRALRDRVFVDPISDVEWRNVAQNWSKPENIQWLLAQEQADERRKKPKTK